METMLAFIRRLIPQTLYRLLQTPYHFSLAALGAVVYGFPSRRLTVIGVTGTKGKSSTLELLNAILEEAGHKTALASTIRFKIGEKTDRNLFKMTMPGRFFLQRFMKRAHEAGCTHVLLEMTSEGAKLFRHRFIALDALIFTNLSPEHIEAHGSFEKYRDAKLAIARQLERSRKRSRYVIANTDDEHGHLFLKTQVERAIGFRLEDTRPYTVSERGIELTFNGTKISSPLRGVFNIYNALAAAVAAEALGIAQQDIKRGIEAVASIPGRVERIDVPTRSFSVIVDYAHTPDSLTKLYEAFPKSRKICVLGNTGGGRDRWKRPEMGAIADAHCAEVILTNEDPYDEDPRRIVEEMAAGMSRTPDIIMDRREAIRAALLRAREGDVVLITGKGTDPFIMGPNGTKEPWSDAETVREELSARESQERARAK